MRIATWNVNSIKVRLPQVLEWLEREDIDVLALQETKATDEMFPWAAVEEAGYHAVATGQATYNGVALLSRREIECVTKENPQFPDPQRRILGATVGGLRVINVYVPNGQSPDSDKFAYKLAWLSGLQEWLAAELAEHRNLVLLGDFNIAPADADVYDPEGLAGQIHCTTEERQALAAIQGLGMTDAFRVFEPESGYYSWWDYRAAAFRRNRGLRIDLILASVPVVSRLAGCQIDVVPRRNERPSDHAPVVATLNGD